MTEQEKQLKEANALIEHLKDYLKPVTLAEILLQERIISYVYKYRRNENESEI